MTSKGSETGPVGKGSEREEKTGGSSGTVPESPRATTTPADTVSPGAAIVTKVKQTSLRELLASVDETGKSVIPLLTELADKQQQSSVLVQRAVLLLGLADKFKDTQRGAELKEDAEKFLYYAEQIQRSEETAQVLDRAQAFIDTVADKYERHGKELFKQSQELWDEVMSSGEAKDFLAVGSEIIDDWKRYGGSEQGQALINSLSTFIKGTVETKGIELLDLVTEYAKDASSFKANAKKHKAMLSRAAKGVKKLIEEDDELKEWVDKGKELLKQKTAGAQGVLQTVVSSEDGGAETLLSEETLAQASQKGQEALQKLKDSAIGQDLLRKGTQVLTELQSSEQLRPENLVEAAQRLGSDPNARQELVTKVKDAALEFLLQYLPTLKVPPLEADDESKTVTLRNIDLSGFKVLSKDVDVTLLDQGLLVTAKNIICDMKNLEWNFKAKTFPYLSTGGTAESQAHGISLSLILELIKKPKPQASQPQAATADSKTATPEAAGESKSSGLDKLDEIFDNEYELILLKPRRQKGYVTMPELSVRIADSWFSSLYNVLLSWFSNEVRAYVEYQVNQVIESKSSVLLGTVNRYAHEYLPILARVKDKVKEKAPQLAQVVQHAAAATGDSTDAESTDGEREGERE